MALINSQFLKVSQPSINDEVERRVKVFRTINPKIELIELDSGEVSLPLSGAVVEAMHVSTKEMGNSATFHGRGPTRGYSFLIDAIIKNDFRKRGIKMSADEIFVNEGTKSDIASIGDILCRDNRIGVIDPIFPTYIDSNVIGYRAGILEGNSHWSNIVYLTSDHQNGYVPRLPEIRPDVIYMSYPNDPTGMALNREQLTKWVKYALKNNVLILFDATYEAFIRQDDVPHSIYEIKDARKVAIEFHSFSKSGSFTGLHCGYTVIPKEIKGYSINNGIEASFNDLWMKRQSIKNNAPSYIIQRAAEALYSPEGQKDIAANVDYYMKNAQILAEGLNRASLNFCGGQNAPYLWVHSPWGSSWKLFDRLLNDCHIVCSPGNRFGPNGEEYVRLSAFADQNKIIRANTRLSEFVI